MTNIEVSQPTQILVIEDDLLWLEVLSIHLKSSAFFVHSTRKAKEGLELLQSETYDLVLLDWNLSGLSGQDLLQMVKVANIQVPIIVLSSYLAQNTKKRALQLGARAFILKPTSSEEWEKLKQTISDLLDIAQP